MVHRKNFTTCCLLADWLAGWLTAHWSAKRQLNYRFNHMAQPTHSFSALIAIQFST
jgi:hypothetical protein